MKARTSARSAVRGVLRASGRTVARSLSNVEMRRLLYPNEDLETSIRAGDFTYFKGASRVHRYPDDDPPVAIGRYCSIADDVEFLVGGEHHHEFVTTSPLAGAVEPPIFSKGPITIGNDVWIGRGVMVTSGVTVADGAVIAARALVTKDVRSYAVVGGVPARELRRRFTDAQVDRLLAIKGWDWDAAVVEKFGPLLQSADVEAFLAAAERRR